MTHDYPRRRHGRTRHSTPADLDQAIASIALSQVGIGDTPASTSFAADCDPYSTLTAGFSANADGCGSDTTFGVWNENETWRGLQQVGVVTTSFVTAWDDTLSGSYLLFAVGQAALDALEFNTCGWANPSTDIPGSTPFDYVTRPLNVLIPAGLFMNGAASTASLTTQRATDLAYYAVHGTLPPGVTSVPAAALAVCTCSGSPT